MIAQTNFDENRATTLGVEYREIKNLRENNCYDCNPLINQAYKTLTDSLINTRLDYPNIIGAQMLYNTFINSQLPEIKKNPNCSQKSIEQLISYAQQINREIELSYSELEILSNTSFSPMNEIEDKF
jgi:hypothetical protein